jgi:hypothetical protein
MQKHPGNPPLYNGSEWMGSWQGYLLSRIRALPRYSLLWVTSLLSIILSSIAIIALLHQLLQAWYLQIVSPCPEWVDRMWTSVGGRDGRGGGGGKDHSNDGRDG